MTRPNRKTVYYKFDHDVTHGGSYPTYAYQHVVDGSERKSHKCSLMSSMVWTETLNGEVSIVKVRRSLDLDKLADFRILARLYGVPVLPILANGDKAGSMEQAPERIPTLARSYLSEKMMSDGRTPERFKSAVMSELATVFQATLDKDLNIHFTQGDSSEKTMFMVKYGL